MERESGYYRVKINGHWEVGYWDYIYFSWELVGRFASYSDKHLEQIDENRIIMPDEENG